MYRNDCSAEVPPIKFGGFRKAESDDAAKADANRNCGIGTEDAVITFLLS